MSLNTLSKIELANRRVDVDDLEALARALGVEVGALLQDATHLADIAEALGRFREADFQLHRCRAAFSDALRRMDEASTERSEAVRQVRSLVEQQPDPGRVSDQLQRLPQYRTLVDLLDLIMMTTGEV